jgi:hypothetical protein
LASLDPIVRCKVTLAVLEDQQRRRGERHGRSVGKYVSPLLVFSM